MCYQLQPPAGVQTTPLVCMTLKDAMFLLAYASISVYTCMHHDAVAVPTTDRAALCRPHYDGDLHSITLQFHATYMLCSH